jgi:excisionase family DNA binding protein
VSRARSGLDGRPAVRNWIEKRELAAVRVGSPRVRVRRSALDAFLEEGAAANHGTSDVAALRDELVRSSTKGSSAAKRAFRATGAGLHAGRASGRRRAGLGGGRRRVGPPPDAERALYLPSTGATTRG